MRLYCDQCNLMLFVKHKIEIELSSEFDFKPEMLTLTNHHIRKAKDTNAFLETKKVSTFYCMDCNLDRNLEQSKFKCDECNGVSEYKSAQLIGNSLILCKACLNGNKTLDFFKIFGKRGPSKDKRDKRAEEALDEANVEVDPGIILEELDRLNIAVEQAGARVEEVANPPEQIDAPNLGEWQDANVLAEERERVREEELQEFNRLRAQDNANDIVFGRPPQEVDPRRD